MKWKVPVIRNQYGIAEVEAGSMAQAMKMAQDLEYTACEWQKTEFNVAENNVELVRRGYNYGQEDDENTLLPFVVDMTERKYCSVVVWAKNQMTARDCVYRMLNDESQLLAFDDDDVDVDNVERAGECEIATFTNVVCEKDGRYHERTDKDAI